MPLIWQTLANPLAQKHPQSQLDIL